MDPEPHQVHRGSVVEALGNACSAWVVARAYSIFPTYGKKILSSGPAWATTEASPQKQNKQQKENQKPEGSGDHPHGLHFSTPLFISGGDEILTCVQYYTLGIVHSTQSF